MITPDVTGVGRVVCPCGYFEVSINLMIEVGWSCLQVICPNCGLVLEPIAEQPTSE